MVKLPSLLEMLKAGAHFGHQKSRWHPKMKEYIFGVRGGVHIIDLECTAEMLAKALEYAKTLASEGKVILFVGTKRQARDLVKAAAQASGMPYLTERWIGGMLTNFDEVRRRLKKYRNLKNQFETKEIERYTKKEQLELQKKLATMERYLSGIAALDRLPDALYIADLKTEKTAVAEADRKNVPIIAVCDSNTNPIKVRYPIPANDDAVNSIRLIVDLMAEAVNEGKAEWEKKKAEQAKEIKKIEPAKKERRALKKEEVV